MMETWHPLGVCGVISAFNFPVAVWSWNAALAFVCGDPVVWKPSEKTPLTALATQALVRARRWSASATRRTGSVEVLIGGREVGEVAGRRPSRAARLGDRLDRHGPAGRPAARRAFRPRHPRARRQQRRDRRPVGRSRPRAARHRLRGHGHGRPALHDLAAPVRARERLRAAGRAPEARSTTRAEIGDPRRRRHARRPADRPRRLRGHGTGARRGPAAAAASVHGGGRVSTAPAAPRPSICSPALVEMPAQIGPMLRETFAPILYVMRYRDFDEAIALHNARRRRAVVLDLHPRPARGRGASSRPPAPIAASPTSISAPPAPRSAARSAARRRPAAAARPARTPGRPICAAPPTRSITAPTLPLAQGVKFDIDV